MAGASPLTGTGPRALTCDQTFHKPQGIGGQQDRPRRRKLFHARGQMCGLPERRVVHVQIVANGADDDLAGVETHANLHLQAVGTAHLRPRTAQRALHRQRRVAGPHGVIFMGKGAPNSAMMPSPKTWLTVPS